MESMQCRNKILNAKFLRSMHKLEGYAHITRLVQITSTESKSLYRDCLKKNECIRDLETVSSLSELRSKIRNIKRSDILDAKKGCKSHTRTSTRISDSIPVSKTLKLSSILFCKTEENGEIQRKLVRWRLGRIAFHQECLNLRKLLAENTRLCALAWIKYSLINTRKLKVSTLKIFWTLYSTSICLEIISQFGRALHGQSLKFKFYVWASQISWSFF